MRTFLIIIAVIIVLAVTTRFTPKANNKDKQIIKKNLHIKS